jgi:hypothetical protein
MIGDSEETLQSQLLVYVDSFYIGNVKLEAGMTYFLDVETKEGEKITANTTIPHPEKITKTKMIYPAGYMEKPFISGPFTKFYMDFVIETDSKFFETFIYNKNTFHPNDPEKPYQILKPFNMDEIILKEGLPGINLLTFIFSASTAPNDTVKLQFDSIGEANPFFTEFYMVLQTCSEEYFLYKKSLYSHLDALQLQENFTTDDLYFPNIFSAVAPVYTNIKGGRGIFAGVSLDTKEAVCNLIGNTCG